MKIKEFMDENFLLDSDVAQLLYHNYAEQMPIIDYHCHVSPGEIAEDKRYENITQLWLYGDHYKWRAMRACGIAERLITGDASDYDKFRAYASTMPNLIGNPLYHWTHLELQRYFGYYGVLSPDTCDEVWQLTCNKLEDPSMSARGIIKKSNVKLICTTDDPADNLEYHIALRSDTSFETQVLPAFRPDKCMNITAPDFANYIKHLSEVAGDEIKDFVSLCDVLSKRIALFKALGCRTADHGFDNYVTFDSTKTAGQAVAIADVVLKRALAGESVGEEMATIYKSALIRFFGKEYVRNGWVMQIHFGTLRRANSVMTKALGADMGYDMIHGKNCIADLAAMLDALNTEGALPKTVLYSLNPTDNAALATLVGTFNYTSEESEGFDWCMPKMQHGSAWWFNDNIAGMRAQMENLANLSAFGKFIGMLTDSRSFLSYTRHEYFRRILCSVIGGYVERGEYPLDIERLAQMVCDICYNNTKDFFGFTIL